MALFAKPQNFQNQIIAFNWAYKFVVNLEDVEML